jgi:hypothetical protein
MHRTSLFLLACASTASLGQAPMTTIHFQCAIEAVKISPRVYAFRSYLSGQEGWRPFSKLALDLKIQNNTGRDISAISLAVTSPHGTEIVDYDNVPAKTSNGMEKMLYLPTDGDLTILGTTDTTVRVSLRKIRYSDGELADFDCTLGSAPIPPPFLPLKPAPSEKIYPIGGEVSPPRILESHPMGALPLGRNSACR